METKHTPGPWNINGVVEGSGQISISAGRCVVADALNAVSAGDVLFGRRPEMQWANAKLIAAAPDLFKALERIARPHDCGCGPCTGSCTSQEALQITVDEIRDLAKAAIAKATA
ncbi:hypothetical protein RGV33_11955 [Pseudomonas sp. Bout1]|uniref:hypothetical protein n=1 Tax=unclassified Pseudomonas TaxID=196821 RepID=UPI0014633895|nr:MULTISPECIES: hypothetical protein [unclassified Pseudomonas]MDY7532380.1 hypothetical protein [Pseudomonas sp. Bout1]MEB0184063.1 hypothetical protein [Pseudomonas sp. Bout1]QJI11983.1 hypothetical protein HKK58_05370 [Pseudomonas sp. ADAK22]